MLSLFDDNVACPPGAIDQSDSPVSHPRRAGSAPGWRLRVPHHPTFKPGQQHDRHDSGRGMSNILKHTIDEPVGTVEICFNLPLIEAAGPL